MGLDHVEYVYTTGMDETTVEDRLEAAETGTLALARDDEAYAFPVAIHWEGERVLLRLGMAPGDQKDSFLASTSTATLVCFEYEDETDSWSVLVRGAIRELGPPDETEYDQSTVNEAFPPPRIFGEGVGELDPVLFALDPSEITGRRTVG